MKQKKKRKQGLKLSTMSTKQLPTIHQMRKFCLGQETSLKNGMRSMITLATLSKVIRSSSPKLKMNLKSSLNVKRTRNGGLKFMISLITKMLRLPKLT